jgi:hypothetical protein
LGEAIMQVHNVVVVVVGGPEKGCVGDNEFIERKETAP